jgi:hypothetical protein
VRVAFLAYTAITNGIPSPHPWSVNRASGARILADARRARRDGAQAVVVNLHSGDEYIAQPSSVQLQLARRLTRSPAITAVVGQHVHVVQPIRFIHRKAVVFGEGNLISNQIGSGHPAASQDGMIVLLTIRVDSRGARVTVIHYVPIWVRPQTFVVLPAGTAWRADHTDAAALRASYRRTVAAVGRTPRIQPIPAHLPNPKRPQPAWLRAWPPPRQPAGPERGRHFGSRSAKSRRSRAASQPRRPSAEAHRTGLHDGSHPQNTAAHGQIRQLAGSRRSPATICSSAGRYSACR